MFEIRSEHNLEVFAQNVDFLVFHNSILLDKEDGIFETGYSFDINARCAIGDVIDVFKLTDSYAVRRYFLNDQGICSSVDLYGREFFCDKKNFIVFLNGKIVQDECYEVSDSYVRFRVEGEINPDTNIAYRTVDWQSNDSVTILSATTNTGMKSFRFKGGQSILPGLDLDNKAFAPLKERTVMFLNGQILLQKHLQFGGNSLKLDIQTKETDEINVLVFDRDFSLYEYAARSGQHIFNEPDLYGNKIRYSSDDNACLLELNAPWDSFAGIRNGYYVVAINEIDGEQRLGMARIQDTEFSKSYVTAEIISPFEQSEYDSSQWFLLPPDSKSIVSYLDKRTLETKAIPEILESLQWYFLNDYHDGLERVQSSRSISKMDESFLGKTINYLGLFFDLSELNVSNRRRALRELNNFYSRIGTQNSMNYLGFIEDSQISLTDALWTSDYINFYTKDELGAKSVQRELLEFTDNRYITSQPTEFDDYGELPSIERGKIKVDQTKLTLSKGTYVVDSATKLWKRIPVAVEWDLLSKNLEDGEYYLLLNQHKDLYELEVTFKIPTNEFGDSEYMYSEEQEKIVRKNIKMELISLPLGKVFIHSGRIMYTSFEVFSHIDTKVFALPEHLFSIWESKDNKVFPKNYTVRSCQELDISSGDYYLVYTYTKLSDKLDNVKLNIVNKSLIHNIGVKPDASFKTKLISQEKEYVYNRFGRQPEVIYQDEEKGEVELDKFGFAQIQYDRKDLWFETTSLGHGADLPVEANLYDSFVQNENEFICTGKDKFPTLTYSPENLKYELESSESGKEWVKVDRVINSNSTDIFPFLEGECFFNLHDFKWYKFSNDLWNESNMSVVGEVSCVNGEITNLIPFINSASFVDENDQVFTSHTDHLMYKRKYDLERNVVSHPVTNNNIEEVAYNWGLITDSPSLGWTLYTEFTPPKGYFPTNHVLMSYTANGVEDTQEMLMKAKYKFYEICPTPWVLQDIANILLFEAATEWVGSTMFGTVDQYFKNYERYANVRFDIPEGYRLEIINNSDEYIYLYELDGSSGQVVDCQKIYSREFIGSNEYITYLIKGDEKEYKRVDAYNFRSLKRNEYIEEYNLDHIEAKIGTDMIFVLHGDEYTQTYKYTVQNPVTDSNKNEIDQIVKFERLYNNYHLDINVISENKNEEDVINVFINDIKKDYIDFLMTDDQSFTVDILVNQRGCDAYSERFTFHRSDFDENRRLTVNVEIFKSIYTVNFTSDLEAFDLYIRRDEDGNFDSSFPYELSDHTQYVPYDTDIYFKYTKDLYNDYEEVIRIKLDNIISRSLQKKRFSTLVTVDPSEVIPVINGVKGNKYTSETGDRIFWSAGNYMYKEEIGEFMLFGNMEVEANLEMYECYKEEEITDPKEPEVFDPITFTENGIFTVPAGINKLRVDCVAAQGNGGGLGGRVQCVLKVKPGTLLYITVGKVPAQPYAASYNASDIRTIQDNLASRIIVAGGGGSRCSHVAAGGAGGGLVAPSAQGLNYGGRAFGGTGGTQTSGGSGGYVHSGRTHGHPSPGESGKFGLGGNFLSGGRVRPCVHDGVYGGAGGAGWFGGGAGAEFNYKNASPRQGSSSGAGGSSYTSSVLCSEVIHTVGYNKGNGYITISMV